jgi:uncharacterized protein YjiS (DUF1127 family)
MVYLILIDPDRKDDVMMSLLLPPWLGRVTAVSRQWWLRAIVRKELSRLSPRLLEDIGLDPENVYEAVRKPFWQSAELDSRVIAESALKGVQARESYLPDQAPVVPKATFSGRFQHCRPAGHHG